MQDPITGNHYIFFRGDGSSVTASFGVVESTDGVSWSDVASTPILSPNPGQWDGNNLASPSATVNPAAARPYVLAYHARAASGQNQNIGIATATDPLGPYTRTAPDGTALTLPVLTPSATSSFGDSRKVLHPFIMWDQSAGLYRMWYTGQRLDTPRIFQNFYATSPDAKVWTKFDGDGTGGPDAMTVPGGAGDWDESLNGLGHKNPHVIVNPDSDGEALIMWFQYGDETGVAYGSTTSFTDYINLPMFTPPAVAARFDSSRSVGFTGRHDGTSFRAFYSGNSGQGVHPKYGTTPYDFRYIGSTSNFDPVVSITTPPDGGSGGSSVTFSGSVTDNSPETLILSVTSDIDGFLGNITLTPDLADGTIETLIYNQSITVPTAGGALHTFQLLGEDMAGQRTIETAQFTVN
jgi:hypothetical protein